MHDAVAFGTARYSFEVTFVGSLKHIQEEKVHNFSAIILLMVTIHRLDSILRAMAMRIEDMQNVYDYRE